MHVATRRVSETAEKRVDLHSSSVTSLCVHVVLCFYVLVVIHNHLLNFLIQKTHTLVLYVHTLAYTCCIRVHTPTHTHTQRLQQEELLLFPRGEGFRFLLFLLCWVHGPASVPLVPVCLNISFCRPS